MHMSVSGSDFNENPIVGSVHFYLDGKVGVSIIDDHEKVNFSDVTSLVFTTEYLMHALEKDEWKLEYMQETKSKLEKFEKDIQKNKFKVIEGGLSTESPKD